MTDIFSIIGSSLNAQNQRMAAIASNLANANSITKPGQQPYRAQEVVFSAAPVMDGESARATDLGVQVAATVQSNAPPVQTYDPGSPYADKQGYVTGSNVNQVDEMVNMIDSSNSYSASVALLQQSVKIDQQMISALQVG
ncbi:flagellar basal body rod protein FlgC [Acidocella sp.]|uniref:flagellar basal body rod protein FlgC n=1 Tax=Acidocella sp. TaxID=50710 RepID=UPI002633D90E|nr:flagellar basal body rod protein FlgC [Acidocella sp.]